MSTRTAAEHRRMHRLRVRLRRISPLRRVPKEARSHLRGAAREQLLAVRSLLDAALARLERQDGIRK